MIHSETSVFGAVCAAVANPSVAVIGALDVN